MTKRNTDNQRVTTLSHRKQIEKRDKILELRLEQVQTEENAVETEIESIKGVIDKNIENSFKTFA